MFRSELPIHLGTRLERYAFYVVFGIRGKKGEGSPCRIGTPQKNSFPVLSLPRPLPVRLALSTIAMLKEDGGPAWLEGMGFSFLALFRWPAVDADKADPYLANLPELGMAG